MKSVHIKNSASAIPRRSRLGLLVFNHAFFIGESKRMGIEITLISRRYEGDEGHKITWFRYLARKTGR